MLALYHVWRVKLALKVFTQFQGAVSRECPICGYHGSFWTYGDPPRADALCPKCSSLERHRLLRLALYQFPLPSQAEVLHFAPEKAVSAMLPANRYHSADLDPRIADQTLNMEAIALPNESVDVVVANHVLEHVDDQKALHEIHRVLRCGGLFLATVPIIEGWDETYENPHVVSALDRRIHFGQEDHVRMYGRDFRRRIREAGFWLEEFVANGVDCARYALMPGERVFIARR